jgi:hypothetical protein
VKRLVHMVSSPGVGVSESRFPDRGGRVRIRSVNATTTLDANVGSRILAVNHTPAATNVSRLYFVGAAFQPSEVAAWVVASGLSPAEEAIGGVRMAHGALPTGGIVVEPGDDVLVTLSGVQAGDNINEVVWEFEMLDETPAKGGGGRR